MEEDKRILSQYFRVGRQLGDGGQARIYEVFDPDTNTTLAVKLVGERQRDSGFRRAGGSDEVMRTNIARLRQEYSFLRASPHPCLLTVHKLEEDKRPGEHHYAWFTMELCVDTVSRMMKSTPLQKRVQWAFQLLDGLAFVHVQRISHRDVKPANLLLIDSSCENIKIGDFGIASDYGSLSSALRQNRSYERAGTRYYMAPEAWQRPQEHWDESLFAAIDQYAAGITIFEMLTLGLPRKLAEMQVPESIRAVHMQGLVDDEFRLEIPERPDSDLVRVEQVLRKMLAVRSDQRYTSLSRCKLDLMCAMFNDGLLTV